MTNQAATLECSNCGCGCTCNDGPLCYQVDFNIEFQCTWHLGPSSASGTRILNRSGCSNPAFHCCYSDTLGGVSMAATQDRSVIEIVVANCHDSGNPNAPGSVIFAFSTPLGAPPNNCYPQAGTYTFDATYSSPGYSATGTVTVSIPPACEEPPEQDIPCCTEGGCIIATPSNCEAVGGTPRPDLLSCGGNPCAAPPTIGACCFANGSCSQSTAAQCTQAGGVSWHANIACNPSPCGNTQLGACCFGTLCSMMTQNDCALMKGFFGGVGTSCNATRCVTGCCVFGNGNCSQAYANQCHGTFYPGIHCPPSCIIGHGVAGYPVVHDESDFVQLDIGAKFIDAETGDILEKLAA